MPSIFIDEACANIIRVTATATANAMQDKSLAAAPEGKLEIFVHYFAYC